MKSVYRVLAMLVAVGVLVQIAAIAYAWFDVLATVDDGGAYADRGSDDNAGHAVHAIVGLMVIPAMALALLVVSFFAKVPGGSKWAAVVLGVVVVQVALAIFAYALPAVGALHGLNAVVLAAVASRAGRLADTASQPRSEPSHAGV